MHGINNNTAIEPLLTRALSLTPTGNHAGKSITVPDKEIKSSFQDLTSDTLSLIFRHLKLRDIRSLQKVCTRLRDLIKEDNTLAKAWYRQFSSAHQNQMRMTLTIKDKNQLRAWFESFSNDQALLESLTDRQPTSVYSSALLFFTRARLMSECETFELVTKATIDKTYKANSSTPIADLTNMPYLNRVNSAALSADGRYLVTANGDHKAKIYGLKANGIWEIKTTIPHDKWVVSAIFSPDSHHVLSVSLNTAKIYDLAWDESWEPNTTILHNALINSATFSSDSRHAVITGCDNTGKILSRKDDGSWRLTATLRKAFHSANFSDDSCHVVTTSYDKMVKIHSQMADGSWEEKDSIPHSGKVISANFSPNGCYLVTTRRDFRVKLFEKKSDGSWEENTLIEHNYINKSATFSPDSRHLLTASSRGTVRIYGQKANGVWKVKATFYHDNDALPASFSPDGRHLVTIIKRCKTAKIIGEQDDGSWLEKANIVHDDFITSATFSADGSQVITSSKDGIVKITELRRNH
ncbi:F-box/WD40 repeat-containing protein [Endozoicomonas sp. 8E]|uniref:F-box/WD repeat-containing protein n=1 Tax=Endozoicomonas sp. 8E TaxID=3035692 RepID=UPI00293911CB|nr:F-box/WD40 repeat-containing protein [Endozoicomonas sp. 8E]WOG30282.1 F-box/WD40 repeat-containing protein [Endozoicomonas sp. 8E]